MRSGPGRALRGRLSFLAALAGTVGCGAPADREPSPAAPAPSDPALFRDVTAASGLEFEHFNGGTGRKYLPEIMGSGGCALDFDGDGWMDVYLVQAGRVPGTEEPGNTRREGAEKNRLFRNLGDGTFEDVTEAAGAGDTGYGMGAVAGDYDNDGDTDLYVVNFGPDVLLRNDGDGTFSDVSRQAGIASPLWGSSATFLDADQDGWLDLYVVNYLDFTVEKHVECGKPSKGILSYCHPDVYDMAPDVYFKNRGDGTFAEATESAGLADATGKGLGVVAADFNGDGWTDIYVANDSTPNFLYRNRADGTFEEAALFLGVGYNEDGLTEAGMGTDAGDVDGDGYLDIFVTNLSNETNALYLGGPELFEYHTRQAGLYADSYLPVGFGTDLLDLDNDGDLDLVVTNGHVIDNVELLDDAQTFRQASQVFFNDGSGSFTPVDPARLGGLAVPRVGRGTVTLDADNDGRLDVLVTFNGDRARLFRNELPPAGSWIGFELVGQRGNRDAVGARVRVSVAGRPQIEERKTGSGYQSAGDPRLHFGLGGARRIESLRVRWPGGAALVVSGLEGGKYYRVPSESSTAPMSSPRTSQGLESRRRFGPNE